MRINLFPIPMLPFSALSEAARIGHESGEIVGMPLPSTIAFMSSGGGSEGGGTILPPPFTPPLFKRPVPETVLEIHLAEPVEALLDFPPPIHSSSVTALERERAAMIDGEIFRLLQAALAQDRERYPDGEPTPLRPFPDSWEPYFDRPYRAGGYLFTLRDLCVLQNGVLPVLTGHRTSRKGILGLWKERFHRSRWEGLSRTELVQTALTLYGEFWPKIGVDLLYDDKIKTLESLYVATLQEEDFRLFVRAIAESLGKRTKFSFPLSGERIVVGGVHISEQVVARWHEMKRGLKPRAVVALWNGWIS